ncbi:MAG: DNA replication and repair protein RecF [Verrucomicrobiota bacterium]
MMNDLQVLKDIYLENFRCHQELLVEGFSATNLITGPNGSGKTTLLEAIYFLARCKSFRTGVNKDLIAKGQQYFAIRGDFDSKSTHRQKVVWSSSGRELSIDKDENVRFNRYWGASLVVVIANQDKRLVDGPAQKRRSWADSLMATLDQDYLHILQDARALLKQKSALLKHNKMDRSLWEIYTDKLTEITTKIATGREQLTQRMSPVMEGFYSELTNGKEKLEISYESRAESVLNYPKEKLLHKEMQMAQPILGPHRDDWTFKLEGGDIRVFGSEGQQKSTALALKLAEQKLIEVCTQKKPIVLVDDALNELDDARKKRFWEYLPKETQLFYATPEINQSSIRPLNEAKIWRTSHSEIIQEP